MTSTRVGWTSTLLMLALTAGGVHSQSYTAVPRWGQASAIIYNTLLISGGKTDPEHQYTYTSAPNSNDLLCLNLSTSFPLSSPPWSYISGSQNTSTSQGPAVAFHTLTPYTSSDLLAFGGNSGFNSIQTNADSAWLLNVTDSVFPLWTSQAAGWSSEPIRRVYHAAPSASGAIYILGGEKADGSQIGFPDAYLFNAVVDNGSPAFSPLTSTTNAPAGLFGHAAHVLPGGTLLVFGGFFSSAVAPNAPSPLTTIYTLDTTSTSPTWSLQNATGSSIPLPRRGFASAFLGSGKILIHGGADAALQTFYSDGAILDTTQSPMMWSTVDALSGTLGPRIDHFAVPINSQVLFGFGWAGNAAASVDLALFDPSSNTFQTNYIPPTTPISITTLPISPTSPGGTYPTSGQNTGQGDSGSSTHSGKGSSPSGSSGQGGGDGSNDGSVMRRPSMTSVIVGSVFGFLALVGLVGGGVFYVLRQREHRSWKFDPKLPPGAEGRWRLMPEEDPWGVNLDGDSPTQPGMTVQMAGTRWHDQSHRGWGTSGLRILLGIGSASGTTGRRRLDMLADEDARQFDVDSVLQEDEADSWSYVNTKSRRGTRRQGTGGSSVSNETHDANMARAAPWNNVWDGSVTSLRNIGVALGVTATDTATHERMGRDANSPEWREKEKIPLDPFKDPVPTFDGEPAWTRVDPSSGAASDLRPKDGEPNTSLRVSPNPYIDPFTDPHENEAHAEKEDSTSLLGEFRGEGTANTLDGGQSSQSSLPRSFAMMALARAGSASPGSDRGGRTPDESQDALSFRTTQTTSYTDTGVASSSTDHSSSINSPTSPRTTSIIGATNRPSVPMRRSDSWWSRFSRTSFLDRHSTHVTPPKNSGLADFRDPNPPPLLGRLGAIQESTHPTPQASEDSNIPITSTSGAGTGKAAPRKTGSGYAPSTKSSIKTANSELIERMDGRMEVVQRAMSLTSRGTASPAATFLSRDDSQKWGMSSMDASGSEDTHQRSWTTGSDDEIESIIAESPTEATFIGHGSPTDTRAGISSDKPRSSDLSSSNTSTAAQRRHRPPRRTLTGAVAERVSAYEKRMSQGGLAQSPPLFEVKPRATDKRSQRGGVGYGLVPKAPLFVANPDRRDTSGST